MTFLLLPFRFGTLSHILASTELNCCNKKNEILSDEALIEKNAVAIVKAMQKLRGIDGEFESESGSSSNRLAHRRTIQMLEKNRYVLKVGDMIMGHQNDIPGFMDVEYTS